MSGLPLPPGRDSLAIGQLRRALDAADFDAAHVSDVLLAEGPNLTPSPSHVPVLLRSLTGDDPLTTLIRLFVAAVPVPVDSASAALRPLPLDKAAEMNLVTVEGDGSLVRPAIRLVPAGPMLVACDLTADALRPPGDVVIGVSSTSWTLAHLTFRRPVETALDVGTGCGIQALLAAGHAARVTATDTNVRALEFARFSAALNHLENIEFLEGNLYEPVAGRRFDLVLANPPFVISPDHDYQYRDGGHVGDELSRLVVEGAGALVSPGGFAHTLVSWVHEPGGDWSYPLREWTDGLGCDAWLLRFHSQEPEEYALGWNQPLEADRDLHAAAIGRWLDYFEHHGIEAIGYGAVVLRRRPAGSGSPWVRAQSLETLPVAPAGEQVRDMFAAASLLDRVGGAEGLVGERLVADEGLRMEQVLLLRDGAFEVVEAVLHLDQALPMVADVDDFTAHLLAGLQQGLTLGEAFGEAAAILPDEVDDEDLRRAAVEFVEALLERGFLHPG